MICPQQGKIGTVAFLKEYKKSKNSEDTRSKDDPTVNIPENEDSEGISEDIANEDSPLMNENAAASSN